MLKNERFKNEMSAHQKIEVLTTRLQTQTVGRNFKYF